MIVLPEDSCGSFSLQIHFLHSGAHQISGILLRFEETGRFVSLDRPEIHLYKGSRSLRSQQSFRTSILLQSQEITTLAAGFT